MLPTNILPLLAFEDLVVQFYDKNFSTHDLLLRLNMTSCSFDVRNICPSFQYSCELLCPLDTEERERDLEKPCYCDELCIELGDCCYDYFSRLVNSHFFFFPWSRSRNSQFGREESFRWPDLFVRNKLALVTKQQVLRSIVYFVCNIPCLYN